MLRSAPPTACAIAFVVRQSCENGVHYLLSLWSRLTVSIPFMKGDMPTHLNTLVPGIFRSFLEVRLTGIRQQVASGDADEIFDDMNLEEQMQNLPTLARLNYVDSAGLVISAFRPIVENYQKAIEAFNVDFIRTYETQLAWLTYVISALGASQALPGTDIEAQEALDADMVARVIQLIKLIEVRQTRQAAIPMLPALASSMIVFFTHVRRQYIGNIDASARASSAARPDTDPFDMDSVLDVRRASEVQDPPIYARLAQHLGPITQMSLLSTVLSRLVEDLKYFSGNAIVIQQCLALLQDLSSGYNSSKMMMSLGVTRAILSNHGVDNFPFMTQPANFKARSTFYTTLGRLIFAESNVDLLEPFFGPFSRAFALLDAQADLRAEMALRLGIGLCRDLRGIVRSTSNNKTFSFFFEWFFPVHWNSLLRMLNSCWDMPVFAIPFLRLLSELVFNKSQRCNFDVASPNGLILFKEAAKALDLFGAVFVCLV